MLLSRDRGIFIAVESAALQLNSSPVVPLYRCVIFTHNISDDVADDFRSHLSVA